MKPQMMSGICLVAALLSASGLYGQTASRPTLTIDGAKSLLQLATSRARELGAPGGCFAVVDEGGNLMALERLDGTFAASANVSIGKARTAALFRKPTKVFEEIVNNGRTTMVALNDFTPLQGGMPVSLGGQIVGAIGVSGAASADQDHQLAEAAVTAWAAMMDGSADQTHSHATLRPVMTSEPPQTAVPVTFFPARDVTAAFSRGMPLLETGEFKIHASRRTEAGMAEVHNDETDIAYVVAGSATLVTGGTVVDPEMTTAGETRGAAIEGGESRVVTPGDVFVIPQGVPHWFQSVDGPFLYFVVKPISGHGETK